MTACPPHVWALITHLADCEIDETDPIAHTGIAVLGCERCQNVELFPPQNVKLITPRYLAKLRDELAHGGWKLPLEKETE